jgi:hypothetical protein
MDNRIAQSYPPKNGSRIFIGELDSVAAQHMSDHLIGWRLDWCRSPMPPTALRPTAFLGA